MASRFCMLSTLPNLPSIIFCSWIDFETQRPYSDTWFFPVKICNLSSLVVSVLWNDRFTLWNGRVSSFSWCNGLSGPRPPHYRGFLVTLRYITLCRTPLDERSTRRRDQYLTTKNTHQRLDIHATDGIQTRNTSKRATAHSLLRLRSRRYWRKCRDYLLNNSTTLQDVRCQFWC